MEMLKLPIGFEYNGNPVRVLRMAETAGEAEKVFTKDVGKTRLYSWFGEVISVATEEIAGETGISPSFIKDKEIPSIIKKIPLLDAGTLLLQIHTEAWQEVMYDQDIRCKRCGSVFKGDVDLGKIEIPDGKDEVVKFIDVDLKRAYTVDTTLEKFKDLEGLEFNFARFRVPTLGDAIRHQGIATKEIDFWRKIAFDCLVSLYYKDENGDIEEIPKEYISYRSMLLYEKDLRSKSLRAIREGLSVSLPSAKMYYEDECPVCKEQTPYVAPVENFFSV